MVRLLCFSTREMVKSLGCRFDVDLTSGFVPGGRDVGIVFVSCTVMAWYYQVALEVLTQDGVNGVGRPSSFACGKEHRGWVR